MDWKWTRVNSLKVQLVWAQNTLARTAIKKHKVKNLIPRLNSTIQKLKEVNHQFIRQGQKTNLSKKIISRKIKMIRICKTFLPKMAHRETWNINNLYLKEQWQIKSLWPFPRQDCKDWSMHLLSRLVTSTATPFSKRNSCPSRQWEA